jgi:hypothetical protein
MGHPQVRGMGRISEEKAKKKRQWSIRREINFSLSVAHAGVKAAATRRTPS